MRPPWQDLAQRLFFLLAVRPFLTLFIGLRVRGREHLPESGPFVLVANHASHLDTVSLLALFPLARLRDVRPVAAADYFERTRLTALVSRTLFNILPIRRRREDRAAGEDPLAPLLEALAQGQALVLFPEGTRRSEATDVGEFKAGIAHLVERRPGLTVVPCWLANMGRTLPKGELVPVPFICRVSLGAPLQPSGSPAEILAALERAVRTLRDSDSQRPSPDRPGRLEREERDRLGYERRPESRQEAALWEEAASWPRDQD